MSSSPFGMAFGLFFWLFVIAAYLFFAYTQYRVAQKCGNKETAWWAFVPIMNILLFCQMAHRPLWWAALLLIPIVNLAIFLIMGVELAKNAGHSPFWGITLIIPFLNIVAWIVMAFTEGSSKQHPALASHTHQPQRTPQSVR